MTQSVPRQVDGQAGRRADRQKDRWIDRWIGRQLFMQRQTGIDRHTCQQKGRRTHRQAGSQADRQEMDRQTDGQSGMLLDRQACRQTEG